VIEKLVGVGWIALALLLGAGASGYFLGESDERLRLHLGLALLVASAFLLVYAGLAIYLVGTAFLVRRTVAREGLEERWVSDHRSCWAPSLVAIVVAVAPLALAFASGYFAYTGDWDGWVHHLFFPVAALFQLPTLLLLRSRVARGEAQLGALGRRLHPTAP
jgi:hypothetical protein